MRGWGRLFLLATMAMAMAIANADPAYAEDGVDRFDVFGHWRTEKNEAVFEVVDCGDGSPCGAMVWINPEKAETFTDENNPDPALRGRPLIGAQVMWGFERGRTTWKNGRLYHAEHGKTYKAKARRISSTEIVVKGCVALICLGETWTAAEPPFE